MCQNRGSKNGQKWATKMWNQDFWVLHHRIITTLTFSKWFAAIEPKFKKILAGQEFFPPLTGKLPMFERKFFGSGNNFWTIGWVALKLSENVKYTIIPLCLVEGPGHFWTILNIFWPKIFKIVQKCLAPSPRQGGFGIFLV